MDALGLEKFGELGVLMDHIAQEGLLDVGVLAAVAHTGVEKGDGQDGHHLEAEGGIPEVGEEEGHPWEEVKLEGVHDACPASPVHATEGEETKGEVLEVSVPDGLGVGHVFWLLNEGGFEVVAGVGIVGVLPLGLPTGVVGVAGVELDLVELDDGVKTPEHVGGLDHRILSNNYQLIISWLLRPH